MADSIKPDGNTVIFDDFNGANKGTGFGIIAYSGSLNGLGQAVDLPRGSFIKYPFPSWYRWDGAHSWNRNEAAAGTLTQGTVEMWIKPRQHSSVLLEFNWYDTASTPSSGHIWYMGLNADGKLIYGVWGGHHDTPAVGKTTLPLGKWAHVAVAWGPNGTKLYVNGVVDARLDVNIWPAFIGTTFAYLNHWGTSDLGCVDELHISKVARTDEEIRSHAKMVRNPIGELPVIAVENIGNANAKRLEKSGVRIVEDMALADVFALSKSAGIPLATLYAWKRKAMLATDVAIDKALFGSVSQMQVGAILTMPDEELGRKTNQPMEVVSSLKKDLSALLISLDDAAISPKTLGSLTYS